MIPRRRNTSSLKEQEGKNHFFVIIIKLLKFMIELVDGWIPHFHRKKSMMGRSDIRSEIKVRKLFV